MRKYKVPTIETDRLYLRRWKRKDAADLFEYAKNPNVGPAAGWKPHESQMESRFVITSVYMQNMAWAVVDKATDKVIGSIGLDEDKFRPNISSMELGYSLSEDYWGRGLITEAAKGIIRYAFDVLWLDVLMIKTGEDNVKSQRVIEKCGFAYEGTLRRIYRTHDGRVKAVRCYSMLREEYREMKEREERDGKEKR